MLHILFLVVISLGISYGFFSRHRGRFTVKEFVLMQAVTVSVAVGGYFLARHGSLQSVEHWNGRITGKPKGAQKCCHCRDVCQTCTDTSTDSSGRTTSTTRSCNCTEVCDHFSDYWWKLDVSTGDTITVKDCASSLSYEPIEWTNAEIGEAASVQHYYTNYLKADRESLLRPYADNHYRGKTPEFPAIYGYYKTDKVIGHGIEPSAAWQDALRELNADIGKEKEVDITVIVTRAGKEFVEAIEADWLYGPKNGLVVVVGTSDGATIAWARVVTFSKVEALKIKLRDELVGKSLNDAAVIAFIGSAVRSMFVRTPMAEFEYLASAAVPATGWLIALYLLHIAVSIGLALYFVNNRHTEGFSARLPVWKARSFPPRYSNDHPDLRPGALLNKGWLKGWF